MNAAKNILTQIFTKSRLLEIPYYQRSYVWREPEWDRFLEDMENISSSNKPYFIGSLILKQKPTQTGDIINDRRLIIDGQQRLTTIIIFFKVLSLIKNNPKIFELFQLTYNVDKSKLDEGGSVNEISVSHNHIDEPAFKKIVTLSQPIDFLCKIGDEKKEGWHDEKMHSVKNPGQIIRLYQHFKNYIENNIDKFDSTSIKSNLRFVVIDLDPDEDEQQIFDTINSLGVVLTTSELLKNYFFDANNVKSYEKYWKPVFESDKETKDYWDQEIISGTQRPHLIDLFFNAYLLIKIHEAKYKVSTEDKKDFMRTDKLFSSYKTFINKYLTEPNEAAKKEAIITEVNEMARIFRDFFDPDCRYKSLPSKDTTARINEIIFALDGTTLIPYVLYVLMYASEEDKVKIFEYLESYMMRRVICHKDTRGYNKLFYDSLLTNEVLTFEDLRTYINEKSEKLLSFPNNTAVKDSVNDQYLVNKQNTGILYMLESKLRDEYSSTKLLGIQSYSLEHLMPRKWKETWGKEGMKEEEIELWDKKLYTMGNLTIITQKLNSSISNSTWKTKLDGKKNKPGLRKCASGLATLDEYLNYDVWNVDKIEERAEFLYNKIISVWSDYSNHTNVVENDAPDYEEVIPGVDI